MTVIILAVICFALFDQFIPKPPEGGGRKGGGLVAATELSLNGIDIGIPLGRLNEILGEADSVEEFEAEIRNEKVYALMTDDPSFETTKKIHVNSTYSNVISAYGQNASKSSEKFTVYEYSRDALNGETGVLRFSVDGEHLSDPVVYITARLVDRRETNENVAQARLALHKILETIARGDYNRVYDEMLTNNYKNQVPQQQFVGLCKQLTSVDYSNEFTEVSSSQNSVVLAFEVGSRTQTTAADGKTQKLYTSWKGEIEMVNEAGAWKINVIAQSRGGGVIEK